MYRNYLVLTLRPYISNAPITSYNWLISTIITLNYSEASFLAANTLLSCNGVFIKFSCVVCREFFKHIWATFLIGDSNPDDHSHLLLYFHNGAYNDRGCALLCDLQFFLSVFALFYLQLSHHYVHIFTVTYMNSLLLFGHYSFIACKAFGCFRPSHWVPF